MLILVLMSVVFLLGVQPMMMVVSLISVVFLYSFFIYKIMISYWFGYMLIMVVLSGVMVIFTYMASLMPNESFEINSFVFIFVFIMGMVIEVFLSVDIDMSWSSLSLWFYSVGSLNLFVVSFLLAVMVLVVWVSGVCDKAVRVI